MSASPPLLFDVPPTAPTADVLAALAARFDVREDATDVRESVLHDTFDWRLHARGQVVVSDPAAGTVRWETLDGAERLAQLPGPAVPRFEWDLDPGPIRARLESIIEMRALLPQVRTRTHHRTYRVLNADEKTVVRFSIGETDVGPGTPDADLTPLGRRLLVRPVRGYLKPLGRLLAVLTDELGLPAAQGSLLDLALAALGRRTDEYVPKKVVPLRADDPAAPATRQALAHQLDLVEANEEGLTADLDSEFCHDFRVAVRRSRSIVSEVKGVFPASGLAHWKAELKWLGTVTTPLRDLDVYLLAYEDYRASVPPELRPDMAPFRDHLLAQQRAAHADVVTMLRSDRYHRFVRDWRAFLTSRGPADPPPDAPNAARPLGDVVHARLWKVYKRVLRDGLAIGDDSPAEHLHELRKTCKKLRYLLELFRAIHAPTEAVHAIKALKKLQTMLGAFQDHEVHAHAVTDFAEAMAAAGTAPARTLLAMGALVADLHRRQDATRRGFSAAFAPFASPENRARYRVICRRL